MRVLLPPLLVVPLLAGAPAAQIPQVPPAVTKFTLNASSTAFVPVAFPQLGPTGLGTTPLAAAATSTSLELRRIGGSQFRLAVAIPGVPAALGGQGGSDVALGVFDAATNTATLSALAAAFNTPGTETDFSVSEDGLVAICMGTQLVWSSRPNTSTAFGPPAPVTGITGAVQDPKLFTQGTQRKLAWGDLASGGSKAGNIWVGDFNAGVVSNARILMQRTLVRLGLRAPHPVTEEIPAGSGNWVVHGWLLGGQWNALDADSYWLPGADPSVAATAPPRPLQIWNEIDVQFSATSLGASGTTFWMWDQDDDPRCIPLVAMSGANFSSAGGGTVFMRVMVPWHPTDAWITAIFFGLPVNPPIALPGTIGDPLGQSGPAVPFGLLGVSPVVTLQAPVNLTNPGGVTYSFSVAPGSVPAGVPIPTQAVGINFSTANIYLGNTAAIEGL